MIAYAWKSGLIEVGRFVPSGALPVGRGIEPKLVHTLLTLARHSYDHPPKLLIPGVPEAADDDARIRAVQYFAEQVRLRMEAAK